jgi:hypothetical protein
MRRIALLLLVLLSLVAGACGGGDGGDDNGDSAGSAAGGTREAGSDDADDADTDFSGEGSGDFCDKIQVLNDDESLEMSGEETEEESRRKAQESLDALDDLADDAPPEIEDDVDLLVEGLRPLLEAIAEGKDFTQMSEEEQAEFEALDSEEYEAAGNRVNAYVEGVCGIDTDDDGDTDGQ